MIMNKIIFFSLLIYPFFQGSVIAKEKLSVEEVKIIDFGEIKVKFDEIKEAQPKDYLEKIVKIRDDIEIFIEKKRRVCRGEFSTYLLLEGGEKTEESKKLSFKERKLCFHELRRLQISFINLMFDARKNYLTFLHSERLKLLNQTKKSMIEGIEKSARPKSRKNKRNKRRKKVK